jgi:hypothetical protein
MNITTNPSPILLRLETGFIFLLGLAVFVSKPLIYLSILLLITVTLVRLVRDPDYRYLLFKSKLFQVSSTVFIFGLLSTAIGSGQTEDVGWMFSKTALLPMVVPLLLAFGKPGNRFSGLAGALVGFWIAFVLTGNMYEWSWSGNRYEGATWLVDTWGVICAMFILLVTPLIFLTSQNKVWQIMLSLTLLGTVLMLLFNGGRGPWVGVIAGLFVYLTIKHRIALIVLTFLGIFSIFVASSLWPQQIDTFESRVQSITKFESEPSSYLRLALWETGYALIKKQMVTGDKGFWFGYQKKGRGNLPNDFYYNEFIDRAKIKPGVLKAYDWELTDFHNSYIESVFRNGVLWTLGSLFVLVWLAIGPLQKGQSFSATWVAVPSLIGFFVIGLTYTLLPHFAFLFLIFFMTLARGFDR